MFSTVTIYLLVGLLLALSAYILLKNVTRTSSSKVKEPHVVPFWYLVYTFFQSEKDPHKAIENLKKKEKYKGKVMKIYIPTIGNIYLLFGEEGRKFFHTDTRLGVAEGYSKMLGPFTPDGMKTSNTKIFGKALASRRFKLFTDVAIEETEKYLKKIQDQKVIDVWPDMNDLTLRLIVRTFCGKELMKDGVYERFSTGFLDSLLIFTKQPLQRFYEDMFVPSVKAKRLEHYDTMKTALENAAKKRIEEGLKDDDFLNVVVRHCIKDDELDTTELFYIIWELFFAAHTNTWMTVSWILIEMYEDENLKKKVANEIDEHLRNDKGELEPTLAGLEKMEYLRWCILEVSRLRPEGTVFRGTREDVVFDGKLIPKDSIVALPKKSTYKDTSIFGDDIEKFNPDRYSGRSFKPHSLLQFGSGKHKCIGERLALLQVKVMVAYILDFQIRNDVKLIYENRGFFK